MNNIGKYSTTNRNFNKKLKDKPKSIQLKASQLITILKFLNYTDKTLVMYLL